MLSRKYLRKKYQRMQSILSSGELKAVGKVYGTDKINKYHSFAGKNYLDIYSMYFSPLRNLKITLLEIGIKGGASLKTFRDFFHRGRILGLDIDPVTAFKDTRITTYIGSQGDTEILSKIFSDHPKIDIVIDDGSHVNELTVASFNLIFSRLQKGGYYIIEDLACSYLEDKLTEGIKVGNWTGMHLNNPSVKMVNNRSDIDTLVLKLIKDIDFCKGEVEYVHFWSQLCIIKKIG